MHVPSIPYSDRYNRLGQIGTVVFATWTVSMLILPGCENKSMVETVTRPAERRLTADYARFRSARISDIDYRISLDLDSRSPEFAGIVDVMFSLNKPDAPLTLDFTDGVVDRLEINGQSAGIDYNGSFITLPEATLHQGSNQVT
ncbi:MAG: hypothetical protein OEU49_06140, partial [Chromatiales bacterium]|nr:hypothetical protein [Chromatiales bacterium]